MTFALGLVLLSAGMHAAWNLMVRHARAINMFVCISVVSMTLLVPPLALGEWAGPPVIAAVPWALGLGGFFLAMYYMGMARSYRGGDFTVAYPLARALPVLMVACIEAVTGNPPPPLGWVGILLIAVGSVLVPLRTIREFQPARYWNRTTPWILTAAVGIAGYTVVDRAALQQLPNGLVVAMRYAVLEAIVAGVMYIALLRGIGETVVLPERWGDWKWAVLATLFVFGSYSLILWAFQSDARASYVIGLRQISIVMGVAAGAWLFREPGARLRIPAAALIATGVILLAVA